MNVCAFFRYWLDTKSVVSKTFKVIVSSGKCPARNRSAHNLCNNLLIVKLSS
jgi:hypothetical protein